MIRSRRRSMGRSSSKSSSRSRKQEGDLELLASGPLPQLLFLPGDSSQPGQGQEAGGQDNASQVGMSRRLERE